MAQENEIKVRNVWASNLTIECDHIKSNVGRYSFASIKCKHFLHCAKDMCKDSQEPPEFVYDFLKLHIGNLPLIQFGFTLFNSKKELPVIEGHPTIWVFNFNMSDSYYCPKILSEASLDMLKLRGVDLEVNKKDGVDPADFRDIIMKSKFLWGEQKVVTWISFMGMYDFGYLIKIFMDKNKFPETIDEFRKTAISFFGDVYDVKKMAEILDIKGSLEEVKNQIAIVRVQGSVEGNAGFDSHLVMQVFMSLQTQSAVWNGMKNIVAIFCGFSHEVRTSDDAYIETTVNSLV